MAMGSPLGVLFANFYMSIVEERVFSKIPCPPQYYRYTDDTFVRVNSEEDLEKLRTTFEECAILHFTCERSVDGALPFLDVQVQQTPMGYTTTVYKKPTNLGLCPNGSNECPDRYKKSVVEAFRLGPEGLSASRTDIVTNP
ncbi:uncharacterized protein [Macrobrachium rosenbergii]|uniref:uncharacterized protein n=1 Tax=Macrobrachium rosenbergii TaxID=79674 RepID=UPI0034D4EFD5